MTEGLIHLTIEKATGALEIVDGNFIKGVLIDSNGEKSAHGKLLMILGAHDRDIAQMSMDEANLVLLSHIDGVVPIQLPLLSYVNDNTPPKSPEYLTGRVVDALRRPERYLGSNCPLILALDRIIHSYTDEQLTQIPQVEWQSWAMITAESAAVVCATTASHTEAGDFGYAYGNIGNRGFYQERSAAVLDAWNVYNPIVASFGYKTVHTNSWSWDMARFAARSSAESLDGNFQRIYANAVNEIQGHAMYGNLKPTKENPKQPDHSPVFIGMLPDPDGQPLSFESLKKLAKADR